MTRPACFEARPLRGFAPQDDGRACLARRACHDAARRSAVRRPADAARAPLPAPAHLPDRRLVPPHRDPVAARSEHHRKMAQTRLAPAMRLDMDGLADPVDFSDPACLRRPAQSRLRGDQLRFRSCRTGAAVRDRPPTGRSRAPPHPPRRRAQAKALRRSANVSNPASRPALFLAQLRPVVQPLADFALEAALRRIVECLPAERVGEIVLAGKGFRLVVVVGVAARRSPPPSSAWSAR